MGVVGAAPSPATAIPVPEIKAIRMVPKRNTTLTSPPSSRPNRKMSRSAQKNRRRTDTRRTTTTCPPSEDEISLGDDEFGVLEDPVEQERFKRRLIATERSLKKNQ